MFAPVKTMNEKAVLLMHKLPFILHPSSKGRALAQVRALPASAGGEGGSLSCWNRFLGKHRRFSITVLTLFAVLATGCTMPSSVTSLDEILERESIGAGFFYGYRCTVGAHRGASTEHRENTMAALEAADQSGKYAFIEFDVQYSKDKQIVVYHDKRLLRLFGNMSKISEATFAELSEMTYGEIAAYDNVIGTLEKKINIEIKSQGVIREDERLVDEIVSDIGNRGRERDVMISSISGDVIKYINRKYPHIPTGQIFWLTSSTYLHFDGLTRNLYKDISTTKADYLMLHVANLRNIQDLLKFKPRGKTIVFWDFDDSMYIVHKDFSDRLWGDSFIENFYQSLRYRIAALFYRSTTENG
jgi:glycerophosphoryl diester phosphodiesterase